MAYKQFTVDVGCPWCGSHDVVVEDHPTEEGYIHAVCTWCGTSAPAIDRPAPGLTLYGTALESWETRRTWEETQKRLEKYNLRKD